MPQNIGDNTISIEGIAMISEADAERLSKYRLRSGDIVYSRRGDVEKRAYVRPESDGWLCGTGCLRVRLGNDTPHDSRFISYQLGTEESRAWIVRHAVGATMPNLNTAILSGVPISLPPPSEQQAIADVLGSLDDKIAANASFMLAAEDLLAAKFAALRLDEEPASDDEAIRVEDLIEMNPKTPAPSESEPVYVDMQKLPVAGMSIAQWTHRPAKGGARFQNGDTLLARITPCLENRKTGYVDFLDEGQVAIGSTEYIVMRSRPGVPSGLSFFLAISDRFRSFGIRHMLGTSGRQRLSAGDLRDYRLRVTEKVALESFGLAAKPILAVVRNRTAETRTLMAIRDALLPQLMSGKIRVKDAELMVGDVV